MIISLVLLIGCVIYRYTTRKKKYDPKSYQEQLEQTDGSTVNEGS
ncbi:hypothetical protein RV04_GL001916 [Enterococcus hermanniensis]|uniref:Uncharacterized protein n=2 Tax=Enterococcus hermanniensis TaxID=249189 RepID=A0A1L8TMW0_9ENTE|nr:hypothetical protein RV04_GL001916 [Enterococcus hermanniensis]